MFDRQIYFDAVRSTVFGGTLEQTQVIGQNALLFAWEIRPASSDLRFFAYMLATAFHETAATMFPIEEYGKGGGHDYGSIDAETGQTYYGRGFVQLTWRDNYARAARELGLVGTPGDLEWHAMRALDLIIAALVMFKGMTAGWFTGVELDDYFNDTTDDPINARKIINPDDKGPLIAGYHEQFLAALEAAWIEPAEADSDAAPEVTIAVDITGNVRVRVDVDGEITEIA